MVRSGARMLLLCVLVVVSSISPAQTSTQPIRLHVDLTDATRNIYHAHLQLPVRSGDFSLVFPKWIPGNHRPSGPIGALTGIRMEAGVHSHGNAMLSICTSCM